jgi:hypothetical protein
MFRVWTIAAAAALCAAATAGATTYAPVTFDELVTRADVIFVGEVVDVRPLVLDTREGTIIKTRVVFRVNDAVFGTSSALEVFEFYGGEANGVGMAIAGMPRFAVGDRRVLFARRARSINPIVGFTQGLLQVRRDSAGVDRILTMDGMPVAGGQSLSTRAPLLSPSPVTPMRLSDFRSEITRALGARAR